MRVSCSTLPKFFNTIPFVLFTYLTYNTFQLFSPLQSITKVNAVPEIIHVQAVVEGVYRHG